MSRCTCDRGRWSSRGNGAGSQTGNKALRAHLVFYAARTDAWKLSKTAKTQLSRRQLQGTSRFLPSAICACRLGKTDGPNAKQKSQLRSTAITSPTPPARRIATKHTYRASFTGCLRYACFGRKSPDIGSNDPHFQQRIAIEARPPHTNIGLAPAPVCTLRFLVLEARVEELAPGRRYESAGLRSMPPTV